VCALSGGRFFCPTVVYGQELVSSWNGGDLDSAWVKLLENFHQFSFEKALCTLEECRPDHLLQIFDPNIDLPILEKLELSTSREGEGASTVSSTIRIRGTQLRKLSYFEPSDSHGCITIDFPWTNVQTTELGVTRLSEFLDALANG
jgi:hypothetical protein